MRVRISLLVPVNRRPHLVRVFGFGFGLELGLAPEPAAGSRSCCRPPTGGVRAGSRWPPRAVGRGRSP
eukprot:scaffold536_cov42-Phaeocystis_antarctica.AAC.2